MFDQSTADTTIDAPTGAVLVIVNGRLDTNGFTFAGSNLTVVFTGSNSPTYQHIPTGSGTFDISAPTSGPWSGIAIYQDPDLTAGAE